MAAEQVVRFGEEAGHWPYRERRRGGARERRQEGPEVGRRHWHGAGQGDLGQLDHDGVLARVFVFPLHGLHHLRLLQVSDDAELDQVEEDVGVGEEVCQLHLELVRVNFHQNILCVTELWQVSEGGGHVAGLVHVQQGAVELDGGDQGNDTMRRLLLNIVLFRTMERFRDF